METIELNGKKYSCVDSPEGNRAVMVVDRGWIFAGDVTEEHVRIYLSRAVWVFRWETIGFAGVIEDPNNNKVDLRPIADIDIPVSSEVFRIPVAKDWGISD